MIVSVRGEVVNVLDYNIVVVVVVLVVQIFLHWKISSNIVFSFEKQVLQRGNLLKKLSCFSFYNVFRLDQQSHKIGFFFSTQRCYKLLMKFSKNSIILSYRFCLGVGNAETLWIEIIARFGEEKKGRLRDFKNISRVINVPLLFKLKVGL